MPKTAIFAILAALALSGIAFSGIAYAGDHHRGRTFQTTAPRPIAEILNSGGGVTTGTIGTVAATWFVLDDGETRIDVTSRGFLPEGLQPGALITVAGPVRNGAIQASRIIREDGTAFGREEGTAFGGRDDTAFGGQDGRQRRHHDDD